ncbi:MAG: hypothetical protein IPL55_09935 [Saprospiraceae bacterium]|nr:hypothetical protein [Saprospiraceae bacterium]
MNKMYHNYPGDSQGKGKQSINSNNTTNSRGNENRRTSNASPKPTFQFTAKVNNARSEVSRLFKRSKKMEFNCEALLLPHGRGGAFFILEH